MRAKRGIIDWIGKMPNDATLDDIVRWVNVLDLTGAVEESDQELLRDLQDDVTAYFNKKSAAGARPNSGKTDPASDKTKALGVLKRMPDDITTTQALYHLSVLRDIEIGLAEAARGEGEEHEEFFSRLLAEDEKSQPDLDASRPKPPARNKVPNRPRRSASRAKVRKAT